MTKGRNRSGNQENIRHANRVKTQEERSAGRGKRNQQQVVEDRWAKKDVNGRVISEKFIEERRTPPLVAKTAKQKHYLDILKTCNIIVAEGLFGSGKSFCAAATAADMLRKGDIDKIIVARAYVQTGKTAGFRPGTTLEKLFPYVRNILDTVKARMGAGAYYHALKDGLTGQIEVQALEDIRGRSFDEPCMLIIEEAQQTSPEEMLSIITRISDNCILVISGDDSQKDTKGESGLSWFVKFAKRHNLSGVGFVNFDSPDDIVRGGFVREVAFALAKDKGLDGF